MAMQQPIIGSENALLDNTQAKYSSLYGGAWTGAEIYARQIVSTSGKLKNLYVKLDGSPGSGKTWTFTVIKNGVATDLALVIVGDETSGSNIVHEISVVAGDDISLRATSFGSPTNRKARWTTLFEGDTSSESLILGGGSSGQKALIRYGRVAGYTAFDAAEAHVWAVIPTSGSIKNLYIKLDTNPGTSPEAYRYTLRINEVDTALTCTITGAGTSGSDTTHEVPVSAGDLITLKREALNSPTNSCLIRSGMTFVADIPKESIILGGGYRPLDSEDTEYITLTEDLSSWTTSERTQPMQACIVRKFHVVLQTSPDTTGEKRTFTIRKNNADTAITLDIVDEATIGSDTSHSVTLVLGDDIAIQHIPFRSPDICIDLGWGLAVTTDVAVGIPYYIWGEGTRIHHIDAEGIERRFEGYLSGFQGTDTYLWVEGIYIAYTDHKDGYKRKKLGYLTEVTGKQPYQIAITGTNFRYVDEYGNVRIVAIGDLMGEGVLGEVLFG